MQIPSYQALMLPVLRAASQGEVHIGTVVDELANELQLSAEQRAQLLPSGKQAVFSNRVNWAKSYLSKAGLIQSTRRGYFTITPLGQSVLSRNPASIDNEFLDQFADFRQFRDRSSNSDGAGSPLPSHAKIDETQTPEEVMSGAYKQVKVAKEQDLLDRVRRAPAKSFEKLMIKLLRSMGYGDSDADNAGRVLGGSGDGGVDGVIDQDPLGLDRVYIQAKRYAAGNAVGPNEIRDFFGALDRHKASKGLFVTTSTFTAAAEETANLLSKRIVLMNGRELAARMFERNIGCRVRETFLVKEVDEGFFDSEGS